MSQTQYITHNLIYLGRMLEAARHLHPHTDESENDFGVTHEMQDSAITQLELAIERIAEKMG